MPVNKKKLELYTNKLYRADLIRYKKKQRRNNIYSFTAFNRDENKIRRKNLSVAQAKKVRDTCKNKCVVCGKEYDKDDFEYHHKDGDRSKTTTTNLVLMCHRCHRRVTREAKAKLHDYINRHKGDSSGYGFGFSGFKFP